MTRISLLLTLIAFSAPACASEPENGSIKFIPLGAQADIPERYRLAPHEFAWTMTPKADWPITGVEMFDVRFPSPVTTKHVENNTVYAEYYRPKTKGPHPAVIVLDITGGSQKLSRTIARHLAQNGIAGLFVQMAYYGPRRPPNSKLRLLSTDVDHTIEAVRQTVLDLRRATAFLESRPEVDPKQLGIMGTSLGSFVAALAGEMEPKLSKVCVLLGGGGFVDAYYDDLRAAPFRIAYELTGGSRKAVEKWLAPVDPLTHADLLRNRKLLIVGARHDEIVPAKMAENLWNATGRQQIIWLDAGHYTSAVYLLTSLSHVVEHFRSK